MCIFVNRGGLSSMLNERKYKSIKGSVKDQQDQEFYNYDWRQEIHHKSLT